MGAAGFPRFDNGLGRRPSQSPGPVPGQGETSFLACPLQAFARSHGPVAVRLFFEEHGVVLESQDQKVVSGPTWLGFQGRAQPFALGVEVELVGRPELGPDVRTVGA